MPFNFGGLASSVGQGAAAGSIIPGLGTAIGAGAGLLIGGITSMFSEASQAEQMNENLKRAKEMAYGAMISQDELADRLHSIDRQFNSRLTSVLNTTAIRSRGIANRGVVGAAAAGAVEGSRLATEAGVIAEAQKQNTGLTQSIAQLEMSKQRPDMVGAFVEGGTAGLTAGLEAGKALDPRELPSLDQGDPLATDASTGRSPIGGLTPMSEAGNFNPFLRSEAPRIGNLTGNQNSPGFRGAGRTQTQPLNYAPQQSPFFGNVSTGGY